jgi:cytochrome oxidase Cu insertion factor (SCO1/SenC/PrrC family)
MKKIAGLFMLLPLLIAAADGYGQPSASENARTPDDAEVQADTTAPHAPADSSLSSLIYAAGHTYTIGQLADIAARCSAQGKLPAETALALTLWLRENHPIYTGKSPIEVKQFRGYLMYLLAHGPPNDELYGYVKNELLFAEHVFNVATAAHAAKIFSHHAPELVALLNPLLQNTYQDEWIDITTYELNYPLLHPTKARYEIIKTLPLFGADAYPSVKFLHEIIEQEELKTVTRDTLLIGLSKQAVSSILSHTPTCCRKEAIAENMPSRKTLFIQAKKRAKIDAPELEMLDQNGRKLKFKDLAGRPFALTFFYTRCTNPLKCASTVERLGKLQKMATSKHIDDKLGIYGMTYDAGFDSPSLLKSYGETAGLSFSDKLRFLAPQGGSEKKLFEQLGLRVNYGYGSVNQHGVQLLLVDKKGRIAFVYDNELWRAEEVFDNLMQLLKE